MWLACFVALHATTVLFFVMKLTRGCAGTPLQSFKSCYEQLQFSWKRKLKSGFPAGVSSFVPVYLRGVSPGFMLPPAPRVITVPAQQFDWVAVRIFQLDLLSARTRLHFISEVKTGLFQAFNPSRQVINLQNYSVPSAGLLVSTVGHRTGSRRAWPTEN